MKKYIFLLWICLPLFITNCYFSAFNTPFVVEKDQYSVGGTIGRWMERELEKDTSRVPEATVNFTYGVVKNGEAGLLLAPGSISANFKYALFNKQLPILQKTGLATSVGATYFYNNYDDKFIDDRLSYGLNSSVSLGFRKIYSAVKWDYMHLDKRDEFVFYPMQTNNPGVVIGFILGEDNKNAQFIPEVTFFSKNHLYFSIGFRWRQLKSDKHF